MAQKWAEAFYKGKPWRECRESFISYRLSIDGGTCEHCHLMHGYIVDHIIELTQENITDPLIALNHENLQYLCLECHTHKTFGKTEVLRPGLMFDSSGDIVKK